MPKNIILCSDGTGNTALKGRGTNVFKLYEALDLNGHRDDPTLTEQIAFYDDGVGTQTLKPVRLLCGAIGWGLARNVRQLYAALCRCYEPDDRIYLFGFSRGAFTVRALAGLIADSGVIDRMRWHTTAELDALTRKVYRTHRRHYRNLTKTITKHVGLLDRYRDRFPELYVDEGTATPPQIHFMGVWDTVDAVGLPVEELSWLLNTFIYPFKFPDYQLSEKVRKACHALAIDDERRTFHPLLWDESVERDGRIEQVWFAGAHSNVGGGYEKHGMSLVALDWMMSKAEESGLRFIAPVRDVYGMLRNATDQLYDSRRGLGFYYRYQPRPIQKLCARNATRPTIHVSVLQRLLLSGQPYTPGNLPDDFDLVGTLTRDGAPREGEGPEALRARAQALGRSIHAGKPLLAGARKWIHLRIGTHYACLSFTLLLFVTLLRFRLADPAAAEATTWVRMLLPAGIAQAVEMLIFQARQHLFLSSLLPALLLAYLLGSVARSRIDSIHGEFWSRVTRELRPAARDTKRMSTARTP
ncbi:MAG: DUF2235 domain-containing protein [Candidatus Polarisedimenticolia bacterium]